MNAIVPLNVTAIRVNENDRTNLVSQLKGRTAVFEKMPHGRQATEPSTGSMIVQPLESNSSPVDPMGSGVHLHWSLPDFFRHGTQSSQNGKVAFPHAPNRWLVTRSLSLYDPANKSYGPVQTKSWIVESDYISSELKSDAHNIIRPSISVPLPVNPTHTDIPFRYMGRVVDYEQWNPSSEPASNYLPAYQGADGKPLYLTAIGFVGPSFASYYPECSSVFGFWDHFQDLPEIASKITSNAPLQFKVSYQVAGWIDDAQADPLNELEQEIARQYDKFVNQSHQQKVPVSRTPAEVFERVTQEKYRWSFHEKDIHYTLKPDDTLNTITLPKRTLCAGIMQEVVWNMLQNPSTTYFLNNPGATTQPSPLWSDQINLSAGNTTVEALSTLLKNELSPSHNQEDLDNYELLLDALQLGLLDNFDQNGNDLIELEEALHTNSFAKIAGGYSWTIEEKEDCSGKEPKVKPTLPLRIAEHLHLLNQAQKAYDQGRSALETMREQLFMDWLRFIEIYITEKEDPNVTLSALTSFIQTNTGGELNAVIESGNKTGILFYQQDSDTGEITGLKKPSSTTSLAAEVWQQLQAVQQALPPNSDLKITALPSTPFWLPTDPVVVMEVDRIEPVRRNGTGPDTWVRLSKELLTSLTFTHEESSFHVKTSDLSEIPAITANTPMQDDVQAVLNEGYLLIPMLNTQVTAALKKIGGSENPAVSQPAEFVTALSQVQGGLSPLEGKPDTGLYQETHTTLPPVNPTITSTGAVNMEVQFTNASKNGHAPNGISWNAQTALPAFDPHRVDPFIPVFLIWHCNLDPLVRNNTPNYNDSNLSEFFELDTDSIDYDYKMNGDKAVPFTINQTVTYSSSTTLSRQATKSLNQQIDQYIARYPNDKSTNAELEKVKEIYDKRHILSQGLNGFNGEQTLRSVIAQVTVEDLIKGPRDAVTTAINAAAIANPEDNWYQFGFNSVNPIATGPLAIHNYGPLRSGFADIESLEIVDAFGQRMTLTTATRNSNGSLKAGVSQGLSPMPGDSANQEKAFFSPRVLAPTRLWFRWLSATHDNQVGGISSDFVEINAHPSTSPVFGWMIPNHLDKSFFFYDTNGNAIGSFGIEYDALVYRTRAGNTANPSDLLSVDIGPKNGPPLVNPHLAKFMWYLDGKNADYLRDLMSTTEGANQFLNPVRHAQNTSLAVLIGNPLALTRAVLGLETEGGVLPISQADVTAADPFPQNVNNNRYKYDERQKTSSASLEDVQFPLRLGNLSNINDGLVGYLIEKAGDNPYGTLYSPAAPSSGKNGIVRPDPDTIELTLNDTPEVITLLVDPRAPVHATSGILPVYSLEVPPAQYEETLRQLAITFFTQPMLQSKAGLVLPLPLESGYQWSWVNPGTDPAIPLQAEAGNDMAVYSYTPQTALEGWVRLDPAPKK